MPLSLTDARWEVRHVDDDAVHLIRARGLSEVAARIVALRWGADGLGHADLMAPSLSHLEDPHAMLGMDAALARLQRAIRGGEHVRIITDYDVDGTTSSLILQAALRMAAPDLPIDYHIPNRVSEGYGFSVIAAEKAADDGVSLIVTADIGVRDHVAVAAARARGVDVIVADHHLPAGESVPPNAIVLCPPQEGCTYPNPALAACGVSLKVAQALLAGHPAYERVVLSLLKLAAIGTVADMVPLLSRENRAIVTLGVAQLNAGPHHAGLRALLDACDLHGAIVPSDLGFRIGPRINAAGRVSDATLIVKLLNAREPAEAKALAAEVERLNRERRDIQERLVKQAEEQVGTDPGAFVLVAGPEDAGWHRGVVGIVAARLKDRTHRSAAVVSIHGDTAVGSVRAAAGVHAVKALESASDLLVKFGGHPAAAGFTVPTRHLDALRARLCEWVEQHASDALVATRHADATVPPGALTEPLFRELQHLGPFGQGNPTPRLVVPNVTPADVRLLGAKRRMVKFKIPRPGRAAIDALWWDRPELVDVLANERVDLLGSLSENTYRGRWSLQFRVTDARIAQDKTQG